jgi:secreted trypsin-like serine protease
MLRVFRLLAILILASFFVAPAVVAEAQVPVRFVENVSPGASLRQLSDSDPDLAATLDAVTAEVRKYGRVRVAVKTSVAFAPETLLGDWQRTVQRREIASAAAALRKSMPKARDFEALPDMPYVVLTVDGTGLTRLQSVPGLVRITLESNFNWRRDFVQLRSAAPAKAGRISGLGPTPRVTPRIVGGTNASPGTHPFQVGLMVRGISDNYRARFCGGALVSPYHVVTAAHCVDDIRNPGRELQVLVGTQTLARRGGGKRINISRIFIHPGWNPITDAYDAAVLELATPVTGIAFATLANTEPTTPGTWLRVTGWGALDNSGNRPMVLQQLDVPFEPTLGGSCGSWGEGPGIYLGDDVLCAGGLGGQDSCYGDSGGPLTIDRGAGYTELVGIVSGGGVLCAVSGYPGFYANVAESSINSFLRGIVDAPRAFDFQASNYVVNEAGRRLTLTVTRSLAAGSASVVVATVPGSAAARADFRAVTRKLSFRPGVTSASVTISIVNDRLAEGPESFTVMLSSPSAGFSVGDKSTATVSITDDELAATGQSASR